MPDETQQGPFHADDAVEFKLVGGPDAAREGDGLHESGARAWLDLPVPPAKGRRARRIKHEEVLNG